MSFSIADNARESNYYGVEMSIVLHLSHLDARAQLGATAMVLRLYANQWLRDEKAGHIRNLLEPLRYYRLSFQNKENPFTLSECLDGADARYEIAIDAFLFAFDQRNDPRLFLYNCTSAIANTIDAARIRAWIDHCPAAYKKWKSGEPISENETFVACKEGDLLASYIGIRLDAYVGKRESKLGIVGGDKNKFGQFGEEVLSALVDNEFLPISGWWPDRR